MPSLLTDAYTPSPGPPKSLPATLPRPKIREHFNARLKALSDERSSWVPHWTDLSDHILPRRGRFLAANVNNGGKKNNRIINGRATYAARTLSSGMMAGLTNPARPWFKLITADPGFLRIAAVRTWLALTEQRMYWVFARSNLYRTLPQVYEELGVFGTGPMSLLEHEQKIITTRAFTVGEYMIANGDDDLVNTFYREYMMSVAQMASYFGYENLSEASKSMYTSAGLGTRVKVMHAIEPNDGLIDLGLQNDARFRCVYLEVGSSGDPDDKRVLRATGYRSFPILCPRWHLTSGDDYGRSPGMDQLGDAKQLQVAERRKLQMLDKKANPPMVASADMRNSRASVLPGDVTYAGFVNGRPSFVPAYQIDSISDVRAEILAVEARINEGFFSDLFFMLTQDAGRTPGARMTAAEIAARQEEKLLGLGPVLQRLNEELLDPLIERTFEIMVRNQLIPPPPRELEGHPLNVKYVSILAQAQQAVGITAMERTIGFVTGFVQAGVLTAADKLDSDKMIASYADMVGVQPDNIRSDEDVAGLRKQRAQAQQSAAALQGGQQMADTAKTLSETQTGSGQTMLDQTLGG